MKLITKSSRMVNSAQWNESSEMVYLFKCSLALNGVGPFTQSSEVVYSVEWNTLFS